MFLLKNLVQMLTHFLKIGDTTPIYMNMLKYSHQSYDYFSKFTTHKHHVKQLNSRRHT